MRNILFRGKRIDNGEWVEGFLYVTHNGEYEIGYYNAELNIERLTFDVDPDTVGQYTGLNDPTGKKIFEGDIVLQELRTRPDKDGNPRWRKKMHIVAWGYSGFCLEPIGAKGSKAILGVWMPVVGNIHDNPELLKGDNDNA